MISDDVWRKRAGGIVQMKKLEDYIISIPDFPGTGYYF